MRFFRSGRVRRHAALLTLFVVLVTPTLFGDGSDLNQPPEARVKPPIGSQSVNWLQLAVNWIAFYGRLIPLVA